MNLVEMPSLEEPCKRCDGTGKITRTITHQPLPVNEHGVCNVCGGRGSLPTQFGNAVLDLVTKYRCDRLHIA